jgi:site-specific recombinase XerD
VTFWRKRVEEYVELRRSLGFKLQEAKVALIKFSSFLQEHHAASITISLAMEWAQQDKTARPAEWARRLSFVRGFARHWSAHDSQTEVPPSGLLPHRPGRAHPYFYSDDEVRQLLAAAKVASLLIRCGPGHTTACSDYWRSRVCDWGRR